MPEPVQGPEDPTPSMRPRLRAALAGVPAYVPGRPPTVTEGVTAYKLASNENPYPPLPGVLEVLAQTAGTVNRYPDMAAARLTTAIAAHDGVPPEHVALGPGSVGVLGQILQASAGDGDEVVYAWRSFESYPIVTALAGARSVQVPLTADARHDLPAMAAAVTERTRLVVVCSPNNPTGPAVRSREMAELLAAVPGDVLVVLDEAYREFVRDPDVPDAVALHLAHPNLVVLRTFSKAYGLAGLRVGYALAHPFVAEALRKAAIPFGVSALAQAAAVASLEREDELLARVDALVAERHRVVTALADQGWQIPDTQANFVWLPLGADAEDFSEACSQVALSVRAFPGDGVRVTIGEPEANDRFLAVAERHLSRRHAASDAAGSA